MTLNDIATHNQNKHDTVVLPVQAHVVHSKALACNAKRGHVRTLYQRLKSGSGA